MAISYTGMESLPLDVVNTIYWMSTWSVSSPGGDWAEDVYQVNVLATQEFYRRFANDMNRMEAYLQQNRPYWA